MSIQTKTEKLKLLAAALSIVVPYLTIGQTSIVSAANQPFTKSFVRYNTLLQASTYVSGRACFQPSATNNNQITKVIVQLPTNAATDYSLDATSTYTITSTAGITGVGSDGGTTIPGTLTGSVSGTALTVTLGTTLASPSTASLYCFDWTDSAGTTGMKLPNNSTENSAGTLTTYNGASVDQQAYFSYNQALLTSGTNSVLTVNAIVPPTFSFSLSGQTDTFGAGSGKLSIGINASGGRTIGVTTNAASGYVVWAQDTGYKSHASNGTTVPTETATSPANRHGALVSSQATYEIGNYTNNSISSNYAAGGGTAITAAAGTENYLLGVWPGTTGTGGGSLAMNGFYSNPSGTSNTGGVPDPTMFRQIFTRSGPTNGDVVNVNEIAVATATTPAASDYTDTINFVGAGQF